MSGGRDSPDVDRPVLRGLHHTGTTVVRDLAELALEAAPVVVAAVAVRSARLGAAASENRAIALEPYCPPAGPSSFETTNVDDAGALVEAGFVNHRLGRVSETERYYIAALELDEDFEPAHRCYALLLEELGELEDARTAYLWAARLQESVAAWLGVARIESDRGRGDAVATPVARALRAAQSLADFLEVGLTCACIDPVRFRGVGFAAAAQIYTSEPVLPYAAARLADWSGDAARARKHADEALARAVASNDELWMQRARALAVPAAAG